MRNDNKRLLVLLILLAACCAVVGFLFLKPEPARETGGGEALPALSKPGDVTQIAVSGSGMEAYTITNDGEELSLDETTAIELSRPYLSVIWDELFALGASPIEGEISEEMGFSDPTLLIEYRAGSDTAEEVRVGRYSKVRDGYYVRGRGDAVWVIGTEKTEKLLEARQNFYIRNLLDFSSENDFDLLESVTVTAKDPAFTRIRVEADQTWFRLREPFTYICDYRALKVGFLDPAVHLKGTRYVTDQKSEAFGFDDPAYTVTFDYDGEEIEILFGERTEEGTYVCRSDRDFVFTIRDEDIAFLKTPYTDLIGDAVYSRYINFIDSFRVSFEGTAWEFDLENAEDYRDKWLLIHNGTTYAYEEYIGFFSSLMGIPRSRELGAEETDEETDPKKAVTVEVLLKSGETDSVVLTPLNDREYKAVVNGECHFAAAASGVEAFINRLKKWEE